MRLYPINLILALFLLSTHGAFSQQASLANVTVVKAQKISLCVQVEALGTTRANEIVQITTPTAEKVKKIYFEDGQKVQEGDILVELDKQEEEAELKSLEALLIEKKPSFERAKVLVKRDVTTKASLQEREASLRQLEADIEVIKAKINDRIIKAPFSGVLSFREVSVGTLVQAGELITTLLDTTQIKVDFEVPSVFLSFLEKGLSIKGMVEAFPEQAFWGQVVAVDPKVNPVTRTVKVRATLPNDKNLLKPGLLINLLVKGKQVKALVVPEEALKQKGLDHYVHIVKEDKDGSHLALLKKIELGIRRPGFVQIESGLMEGDLVVERGNLPLKSNIPLKITDAHIHEPKEYKNFKCESDNGSL